MSGKISFFHNNPKGEGYILLSDLLVDDTFRCREQEDEDTVESYTAAFAKFLKPSKADVDLLKRGGYNKSMDYPFPPAWVWREDDQYYLITGYHRFQAATNAGQEKLLVREFQGTKDEAIQFAIKDNLKNGLRLSYGDWKYCIGKALRLFPGQTPGAVAKELGCSRSYAYRINKELSTSGQLPIVETKVGADGKKRSVKRKIKQPATITSKQSGSIPVPNAQSIEGLKAASEQNSPAPQETPNDNAPFDFGSTPSATIGENIKPSSLDLKIKMDGVVGYIRNTLLNYHDSNDRAYFFHRIREGLRQMEEENND